MLFRKCSNFQSMNPGASQAYQLLVVLALSPQKLRLTSITHNTYGHLLLGVSSKESVLLWILVQVSIFFPFIDFTYGQAFFFWQAYYQFSGYSCLRHTCSDFTFFHLCGQTLFGYKLMVATCELQKWALRIELASFSQAAQHCTDLRPMSVSKLNFELSQSTTLADSQKLAYTSLQG